MVTWNRREYFERTIAHLLADKSDFRLYFWDNASADGVRDIISELRDDRIKIKNFSPDNVGQFGPWHWFMENCAEDIAGKLDDDILGEPGWPRRFSDMIIEQSELGAVGAWVYLESDWNEAIAAPKIVKVGRYSIFRNAWVAGCIFLARTEYLRKYTTNDPSIIGVPFNQLKMSKAGLINGVPYPVSFAENLDDPRSPHCRMNRPGGWDQFAAYSARMRGFSGPEEYGRWIADDARMVLETPVDDQIRMFTAKPIDQFKANLRRGLKWIKEKV